MNRIITYLTFNGNCAEAMKFYQNCLGGELYIQLVGETPGALTLPDIFHQYVLQASLRNGSIEMIGTDMVGEGGLRPGNSITMLMVCSTPTELNSYFRKLSVGGKIMYPAKKNLFNVRLGALQDRYGNYWLLQCGK